MTAIVISAAAVGLSSGGLDSRTCFALLERQSSVLQDVSFLYEGRITDRPPTGGNRTEDRESRFQGYYAYRSDGAGLVDVFTLNSDGQPDARLLYSVLKDQFSRMDATPDSLPKLQARNPQVVFGSPASLSFPRSARRIHLAWFGFTLGPHDDHEYQDLGVEEVGGRPCQVVKILTQRKSLLAGWEGLLPYTKLWLDVERGGLIVRLESYAGDDRQYRTTVESFQEVRLPGGGTAFLPALGVVEVFVESRTDRGRTVYTDSPASVEEYRILKSSIKVNQGLQDGFFSIKQHALASSEEEIRDLVKGLKDRPAPSKAKPERLTPSDYQKRLDATLEEADHQSERLDASAAASEERFWSTFPAWLLAGAGLVALAIAAVYGYRRS